MNLNVTLRHNIQNNFLNSISRTNRRAGLRLTSGVIIVGNILESFGLGDPLINTVKGHTQVLCERENYNRFSAHLNVLIEIMALHYRNNANFKQTQKRKIHKAKSPKYIKKIK